MHDDEWLVSHFERHRPHLRAVAYRAARPPRREPEVSLRRTRRHGIRRRPR
jgi:hypothetical protein